LGPNVFIGGGAIIGNNVFIGSGAIIREKVKIGDDCIIGMGSVVVKDVEKSQVVVGNPAKFIRYNDLKKVFN
jgi:acetyltransferase-like isoleucine patch superfamily enzyme